MFRTVPLSIIRSLFTVHRAMVMSYSFVDSFRAGPGCSMCWVYSELTPDDGQRNCPKHVEFHVQNKFVKLVHLVRFIIKKSVPMFSMAIHALCRFAVLWAGLLYTWSVRESRVNRRDVWSGELYGQDCRAACRPGSSSTVLDGETVTSVWQCSAMVKKKHFIYIARRSLRIENKFSFRKCSMSFHSSHAPVLLDQQ